MERDVRREDFMKSTCSTRGGALILTVLLVAAIGILFGFGRLLAFRYQCEQRFDRQRELEKVMATRSVLNYILRSTGNTLPPSNIFTYRPSTNGSVISVTNVSQGPRFDMQFTGTTYSAAISFHDSPIETLMMNTNYPVTSTNNSVGLEIGKDSDAIANLIAGVSMVVTNNWLDPCEVYGLRYFMHIGEVNYYDKSESASGDVQRIYIEPVNRPDVRIMLEQIPDASSECTLRAVVWSNSVPCFTVYSDLNHNGGSRLQLKSAKGLQLCGDIMTIVDNEGTRRYSFLVGFCENSVLGRRRFSG